MITENKEERLNAIIEFIKQNKKSDRVVTLVDFFGLNQGSISLLAWNETKTQKAIYFDILHASSVFVRLLLAYGEAVGFCQETPVKCPRGSPFDNTNDFGLAWGNITFNSVDERSEGVKTSLPKVRNISFGKCVSIKDIFNNGLIYELEVKVDEARDYREEIRFSAVEGTRKELLAELLYPIVTLGLGDNVRLTYEFVEAFIGWFNREDI